MDISEEKSGKEMEKNIPVLSEYAKNLESHVKERYVQKISVVGVDPASLPREQFDSANRINRFAQLFSVGDKLLYKGAAQGFQKFRSF